MTIHDLPTPCAVVDIGGLQTNLRAMADLAAATGTALRPHLKTHKCVEIARMQRDLGARGVTVAKLSEAEVFASAGFDDIFIANLIVGPDKLARLAQLTARANVIVGVDSDEVLDGLAQCARDAHRPLGVRLEVDTGHHRTGVRTRLQAECLASHCCRTPGLDFRGIYTHEGHVYRSQRDELPRVCDEVAATMRDYASVCATEAISVGSTPSAPIMAPMREISEIRPGNYVFLDTMQVTLGASLECCALTVMATVIATPSDTEAFVDAGSKALSGDRDRTGCHGVLRDHPEVPVDWCSEEHAHLDLSPSPRSLRVGEKVAIVPAHACTCVNCHDNLQIADGDTVVDSWPVAARGKLT